MSYHKIISENVVKRIQMYLHRLEGIQIVLAPKGTPAPARNYGGVVSAYGVAYVNR